jgi:hypothetical protein
MQRKHECWTPVLRTTLVPYATIKVFRNSFTKLAVLTTFGSPHVWTLNSALTCARPFCTARQDILLTVTQCADLPQNPPFDGLVHLATYLSEIHFNIILASISAAIFQLVSLCAVCKRCLPSPPSTAACVATHITRISELKIQTTK